MVELVGIAPTSSETQTSGTPCSDNNLDFVPEAPIVRIFRNELSCLSFRPWKAPQSELSLLMAF